MQPARDPQDLEDRGRERSYTGCFPGQGNIPTQHRAPSSRLVGSGSASVSPVAPEPQERPRLRPSHAGKEGEARARARPMNSPGSPHLPPSSIHSSQLGRTIGPITPGDSRFVARPIRKGRGCGLVVHGRPGARGGANLGPGREILLSPHSLGSTSVHPEQLGLKLEVF